MCSDLDRGNKLHCIVVQCSKMFVLSSVPSLDAVLRRQSFCLQSRLNKSDNMYIQTIMSCDVRF